MPINHNEDLTNLSRMNFSHILYGGKYILTQLDFSNRISTNNFINHLTILRNEYLKESKELSNNRKQVDNDIDLILKNN